MSINVKDIWQEAYDIAREQGMSEMMARDHADDKLADLHGEQVQMMEDIEEVGSEH